MLRDKNPLATIAKVSAATRCFYNILWRTSLRWWHDHVTSISTSSQRRMSLTT